MSAALSLAKEAYADDEVPVGAVITQNGKIIYIPDETGAKNPKTLCFTPRSTR